MNLKSKADKYIKTKAEWLEKKGINVIIERELDHVMEDNCAVGGMFNAYAGTLSIACGGKVTTWLPTFIHELQHAKQFLSQSRAWVDICNLYKGEDALGVIFNWLDGKSYPDSIVYKAIRLTQAVELDAEKRTVRELINTGLSNHIDVLEYTRDANGYIYFYNIVYMYRQWQHDDFSDNGIVNRSLPTEFVSDYTKLPMEYYRQAIKYCLKDQPQVHINIANNR